MAGFFRLCIAAIICSGLAVAQHDHSSMNQHHADVQKHGAQAMGFDQDKTTHHFRLSSDGGSIRVEANDPQDTASIGQIRSHLAQQAKLFADGNFAAPQHTHGVMPPGVPQMMVLKDSIQYRYAELPGGGELRIHTANRDALTAIHQFLTFQIEEHRTGDPTSIK